MKYATNDNEYYTPKEFVKQFGKFNYDPATVEEKAEEFGIANYDTIDSDGLTKEWNFKRIWINPPFTNKQQFLAKAVESLHKYHNEIYILLSTEALTTKWFHELTKGVGGIIYLPNGRVKFESGLGKKIYITDVWHYCVKINRKEVFTN